MFDWINFDSIRKSGAQFSLINYKFWSWVSQHKSTQILPNKNKFWFHQFYSSSLTNAQILRYKNKFWRHKSYSIKAHTFHLQIINFDITSLIWKKNYNNY